VSVQVSGLRRIQDELREGRERTLALLAALGDADVEAVHSRLMSPLVWDLGHIAAFEDLWLVHRLGGEPMLRPDLGEVYDAFETPRAYRGELAYLCRADALRYMAEVRERALVALERTAGGDGMEPELVLRHEHQHRETMLQTLGLAKLRDFDHPGLREPPPAPGGHTGLELVDVPGGPFELGASADRFSYDNERPRHAVDVPPFRIGRTPITNATFLSFVEGGGYERRPLWSEEAWRWKQEYDITGPMHWTDDGREWRMGRLAPRDPDQPVVHVSWFEADAFARAHGLRLPTEAEWEKAAAWDQETDAPRPYPWGDQPPAAEHATLDQRAYAPAPAGALPAGASPCGALGMLGDVWEWTASHFHGYPGFVAHPYPEYSEVFFGDDYRVLRGGSWATSARAVSPTFRNWDHPERRQIFAGLRVAADAS